jgi:hypothetical protein
LIYPDEIKPLSGYNLLAMIKGISERYGFIFPPSDLKEALEKGFVFTRGTFIHQSRPIEITRLGIYNDGILVDTASNTDDSDLIVDDILSWASAQIGLRPILTPMRPIHASQVVVDFDLSVDALLRKLKTLTNLVSSTISENSGRSYDLHLTRITLSADPLDLKFPAQSTFYLEPRAGVPLASNRYMSGAPVATSAHLRLLAAIENLLK